MGFGASNTRRKLAWGMLQYNASFQGLSSKAAHSLNQGSGLDVQWVETLLRITQVSSSQLAEPYAATPRSETAHLHVVWTSCPWPRSYSKTTKDHGVMRFFVGVVFLHIDLRNRTCPWLQPRKMSMLQSVKQTRVGSWLNSNTPTLSPHP